MCYHHPIYIITSTEIYQWLCRLSMIGTLCSTSVLGKLGYRLAELDKNKLYDVKINSILIFKVQRCMNTSWSTRRERRIGCYIFVKRKWYASCMLVIKRCISLLFEYWLYPQQYGVDLYYAFRCGRLCGEFTSLVVAGVSNLLLNHMLRPV